MKTIIVSENDRDYYIDMLPGELMFLLYDPDMLLVAAVEETEAGAVPAALMLLSGKGEKTVILEWLYVKEEYRGRGLGEDMMMQAFGLAKETGNGELFAKLRLTKEAPKEDKRDKDGYASPLYGQRDWLDLFGFTLYETQENEWMFFVEDMIDAKPKLFAKGTPGVKRFAELDKVTQGKYRSMLNEDLGEEVAQALDGDVSCALIDEDEVLAILLVLRVDDTYTPVYFYSAEGNMDGLRAVAPFFARAVIEKSDDVAVLHMVWHNRERMLAVKELFGDVPPVETLLMSAPVDMPERLFAQYEEELAERKRVDDLLAQIPTEFHVMNVEYLSGVVLPDRP